MLEYSLFGIKPDLFYDKDIDREEGSELRIPLPKPEDFIDEIKTKLMDRGLEIKIEKKEIISEKIAREHYGEFEFIFDVKYKISKQDFLAKYMTSGYSYWIVFYGENAIKLGREVLKEIRTKYLETSGLARWNMTHASDSLDSSTREIKLHFPEFSF